MAHITVELVNKTAERPSNSHLAMFDAQVVAAARASYGGGATKGLSADTRLLSRLAADGHTSPFEHPHVTLILDIPLMVKVHLLRHRHFNFSSQSYRYTAAAADSFYTPKIWFTQSTHNKQASAEPLEQFTQTVLSFNLEKHVEDCVAKYEWALGLGASREQARLFLPAFGLMYTLQVTTDLLNLIKFFKLRLAPDAQYETRILALEMFNTVAHLAPTSFEVWGVSELAKDCDDEFNR